MTKNWSPYQSMMSILLAILLSQLFTNCDKKQFPETFFEEEELLISDYLDEKPETYSTLTRVLEITNLKATMNAYGHYTFFAPENNAFAAFLTEQGKGSVEDFEVAYLTNLVKYHLLNVEIESSYFRDGVIQDTTYSGDHLVVTFSEGGLETIMVNEGTITERDIHVENGIIHQVNDVLDPVIGSVVDRLDNAGSFELFSDALKLTGLSDSLDLITIQVSEDISFRSRFTLFVESDETYAQSGIHGIQDLVDKYSDTGDPTDKNDGLYQYVAYHVIPDLYFLNNIDSFNYQTLAENFLINVKIENGIFLNTMGDGQFITVLEEESNKQAKNGTYHVIDKIMEPFEPAPVYMVIDLTNYQGISIGREYTEKELEDIRGINSDNTGIYFRNSILADGETNLQSTENGVGWEVEFELPPISRGKYDVYFHWASHDMNTWWAQAFWDGARMGSTFSFVHQKRWPGQEWKRDYNTSQHMGRVVLSETKAHTLKFVSLQSGYGNFDYLVLRPVED